MTLLQACSADDRSRTISNFIRESSFRADQQRPVSRRLKRSLDDASFNTTQTTTNQVRNEIYQDKHKMKKNNNKLRKKDLYNKITRLEKKMKKAFAKIKKMEIEVSNFKINTFLCGLNERISV